ncbi:FCD domain-containing protein [Streptomyces sp. NPDC001315]|uniref:FCD domain-containing protein n=1 Tax=Streptomyces sp. NPDC001315 TaxID=3364562 RepID=UPI0036C4D3AA
MHRRDPARLRHLWGTHVPRTHDRRPPYGTGDRAGAPSRRDRPGLSRHPLPAPGKRAVCEAPETFRGVFHRVRTDPADVPQDPPVTCRRHRDSVHAVRLGDAVRAKETTREHFDNIRS